MADDVLTFEELRQVQSRERDADTLQELDEAFFDRAQTYLDLKQEDGSHLEAQEYRNARNIVEDILDMRQKKIVKLAFLSVKSDVSVDNMLPHEQELFQDVKELIGDYREQRHEAVFDGTSDTAARDTDSESLPDSHDEDAGEATGAAADIVDDTTAPADDTGEDDGQGPVDREDTGDRAEEQSGDATDPDDEADEDDDTGESGAADDILQFGDDDTGGDEDQGEETSRDTGEAGEGEDTGGDADAQDTGDEPGTEADGRVTVAVQERIPEFMGTDLEPYGPFEEGDEVEVPAENADVLVQQGKAERL